MDRVGESRHEVVQVEDRFCLVSNRSSKSRMVGSMLSVVTSDSQSIPLPGINHIGALTPLVRLPHRSTSRLSLEACHVHFPVRPCPPSPTVSTKIDVSSPTGDRKGHHPAWMHLLDKKGDGQSFHPAPKEVCKYYDI